MQLSNARKSALKTKTRHPAQSQDQNAENRSLNHSQTVHESPLKFRTDEAQQTQFRRVEFPKAPPLAMNVDDLDKTVMEPETKDTGLTFKDTFQQASEQKIDKRVAVVCPALGLTSIEDLPQNRPSSRLVTRSSVRDHSVVICDSDRMLESRFLLKCSALHLLQLTIVFGANLAFQLVPSLSAALSAFWFLVFVPLGLCAAIYLLLATVRSIRTKEWLVRLLFATFTLSMACATVFANCIENSRFHLLVVFGFLLAVGLAHLGVFAAKTQLMSFYGTSVAVLSVVLLVAGQCLVHLPVDFRFTVLGAALGTVVYAAVLTFDYAQIERCSRNAYFDNEAVLAALLLPVGLALIVGFWAKCLADTLNQPETRTVQSFRAGLRESFRFSFRNVSRASVSNFN